MGNHLAQNWGNYASVAGLVFSIRAFVFSKRASKAAEQARDTMLRRSLSQDMSDATRAAVEVVRFVGMQHGEMAVLRAGELLNQTSYYLSRWDKKLDDPSVSNLRRARDLLQSVHGQLVRGSIAEMTPRQKMLLAQNSQKVNQIFSEEHGRAMKATDEVH